MADQPVKYRKLPGRGAGWFGVTRIWLGDDHLLSVNSTLGVESYQRFYFREIEALIIRRTKVRLIWNCIFGAVIGAGIAFGAMQALAFSSAAGADQTLQSVIFGFLGTPTILALVFLIINTLRGQSCSVWIQTAGGTARLGTPVRIRPARRFVERIAPLIEQAQAPTVSPSPTAPTTTS
ncbi:hypothetical protein ACXR0O_16085 [Verrucomicrobiota bacterium sgz303538]